jgi:hypothetical protein
MRQFLTRTVVLALVLAACGGAVGVDDPVDGTTSTAPATTSTAPAGTPGELPAGPSALDDRFDPAFPDPLVDPVEIRSGGPPPDGIPPIDEPAFISIDDASGWLGTAEAVVVVEIEGDARAYPVQILVWHEIVNDVVGGVPVSVTYCPLCNSAVAYDRRINGVETTFGTSGRLYNSALVMYDRATETLWTHFDGRAVVGVLTGYELEAIGAPLMAFSDFTAAYPDGVVLDRASTGYVRDYGRNPYVGYDNPEGTPFLFRGALDDRAFAMQRLVGVTVDDVSIAWALDGLVTRGPSVTEAEIAGIPIVILWTPGQRSALDLPDVSGGREVGSAGVFDRRLPDGNLVELQADDAGFFDASGTRWNIAGIATSGPLEGTQLERIPHLDTFWFAWSTYRPGTELITPGG